MNIIKKFQISFIANVILFITIIVLVYKYVTNVASIDKLKTSFGGTTNGTTGGTTGATTTGTGTASGKTTSPYIAAPGSTQLENFKRRGEFNYTLKNGTNYIETLPIEVDLANGRFNEMGIIFKAKVDKFKMTALAANRNNLFTIQIFNEGDDNNSVYLYDQELFIAKNIKSLKLQWKDTGLYMLHENAVYTLMKSAEINGIYIKHLILENEDKFKLIVKE